MLEQICSVNNFFIPVDLQLVAIGANAINYCMIVYLGDTFGEAIFSLSISIKYYQQTYDIIN